MVQYSMSDLFIEYCFYFRELEAMCGMLYWRLSL